MDIEVVNEKDNIFFKRKELELKLKHPKAATPSKQELKKELVKKYKVEEDHIIIDYIFSKKGINESKAKVKIYKEKPKIKIKRSKEKKEKVKKVKEVTKEEAKPEVKGKESVEKKKKSSDREKSEEKKKEGEKSEAQISKTK